MHTDAINRRIRFAPPQPGKHIQITDLDKKLFRALDRHGHLPTPYLFALSGRRYYPDLQKRLTLLYNGYCSHRDHSIDDDVLLNDGRLRIVEGAKVWGHDCARHHVHFLSRNPKQYHSEEDRRSVPIVYSLNETARGLLGNDATRSFKRSSSFVHDLFSSSYTASLELAFPGFIFRDEILERPACPPEARASKTPFEFMVGTDKLIPDDIFGLRYPEGGVRYCALEVDRSTERIRTGDPVPSSIAKKLLQYERVFKAKLHRERLGLPTLSVVFITVSEEHAQNMRAYAKEILDPAYYSKFLFTHFDGFGEDWRVPRKPLDVFKTYLTPDGTADISKKALS